MTLEEAIIHAHEVGKTAQCADCRVQHKQLEGWLKELKMLKTGRKVKTDDEIFLESRQKIYDEALKTYGIEKQMIVALEEFSEIQKELCKSLRGKGNLNHIAEELADAKIMIEQMQYFLGLSDQVDQFMNEKIIRLSYRLKAEGCLNENNNQE